jgi:hypothetical protein
LGYNPEAKDHDECQEAQDADGSGKNRTQEGHGIARRESERQDLQGKRRSKQRSGDSGGEDHDTDGGDDDGSENTRLKKRVKLSSDRLLACPYFKYRRTAYKCCEQKAYATTHRIK